MSKKLAADHVRIEFSRRQVEVLLRAIDYSCVEKTGALRHAIRKMKTALDAPVTKESDEVDD